MRSLLRPSIAFLIASYLILSGVPLVPLALGKTPGSLWQIVGIEVATWIAAWAIMKRPIWFHWFLLPAFLALPTEIYLLAFYGQGITTHHLGIISETSPKESIAFLGDKVWLMLAVMTAVICWWCLTLRVAWRTRDLDWTGTSRWIALGTLAIVLAVWNYGREYGVNSPASISSSADSTQISSTEEEAEDEDEVETVEVSSATLATNTSSLPKLPSWANIPIDLNTFSRSWPFGLMTRSIDFWNERKYLTDLSSKNSLFRFDAHQTTRNDAAETVVMVIGESSRYDRWSLNGYEKETNPLLKNVKNLVVLPDMITSVSATRLSVPVLVSRKPATQSLKAGFSEKSFLTAFKESGFKTYWLSNQISFGEFDTPVSVFAKEADVIQFMNLGGFTDSSNLDQILFDPLKNALADPAPKKLIVLHTLGSHWNYSQRYPKSFDKWQPSLFGVSNPAYTDLKLKPELNNSYDNSILYTDWFLSEVIGALQSTTRLSSLLYVADHGQTLYDGTCNLAFHGHNTQYEFHVPAMVWYSEQYKSVYPAKILQLLHNKKAKLATENIFHSLLDMADIHYSDEHMEWSFFSKQFRQHKRYVDSYGWTNYDNSIIKGDCREVIDKGKPLEQEK